MNINEMMDKYKILLIENKTLKGENEILKARLKISDPPQPVLP